MLCNFATISPNIGICPLIFKRIQTKKQQTEINQNIMTHSLKEVSDAILKIIYNDSTINEKKYTELAALEELESAIKYRKLGLTK